MTAILDSNKLMFLAEQGPFLDQVESELRASGHEGVADQLLKLQQDAGIDLEKSFGVYDSLAGPQTAALDKSYEPVTSERVRAVLSHVTAVCADNFKAGIFVILDKATFHSAGSSQSPPSSQFQP